MCLQRSSLISCPSPTDCKANKVGEHKDGEEDEIKLAECGQVEAELRCGRWV